MRVLHAIDLARSSAYDPLWRTLRVASSTPRDPPAGLPPGGLATPGGFWFVEAAGRPVPDALRVDIVPPGAMRGRAADAAGSAPPDPGDRRLPLLIVPPRATRALVPELRDGLALEVRPRGARVGVADHAWPCVSGPVLLIISQCWRFLEIERRLDDLSARCRDGTVRRRGGVGKGLRAVRELVLDLPGFDGPVVDPRGYFASRRSATLYRAFARRLELGRWRDRIGERVEIVEATLAALAEDRRHLDSLAWMVLLEALILLILFADIGVNLYSTFLGD
jgi:hypothetical protein